MGKPKAPTPPDPAKTAAAQTATNLSTAQANAYLGNVNQVTPDGSLTYTQSGQNWIDDPNGQTYYRNAQGQIVKDAPMVSNAGTSKQVWVPGRDTGGGGGGGGRGSSAGYYKTETTGGGQAIDPSYTALKGYYVPSFTATQTLSPQQQAIKDQQDAAQLNLGGLANNQSAFLKDYLSKPFNIDEALGKFDGSNDATEARLLELGRKRLDPQIAQQDESLRNRLAQQGIKAGSDAYGQEQNTFNQGSNDARNQLILNGHAQATQEALTQRQQAVQEALTSRNQPINEIMALLGGAQIDTPQFVNPNMPTIPTTDTAGIINENYNQKMSGYQQQMAQSNGVLGGLFGLGSKLIGLSDRRAKKDIKPVGRLMGHKLYEYSYKGQYSDGKKHIGVMAQEAEKTRPDAVSVRPDGMRQVNYGKLFEMGAAA